MKKRIVIASALFLMFFTALCVRVGYIALSKAYTAADSHNSYSLVIDTLEPNIYYSNYKKLTNNVSESYALLKPNTKTIAELPLLFDDYESVFDELKAGKPILKKTETASKYIKTYKVTGSENTCAQLLSRESSGLLSYLPESVGEKRISFKVDAMGKMLTGDEGEITDDNYVTSEGLLLTLDERVQSAAVKAANELETGCVLVMDVSTGSLLACVTKPDSSYINKPFRNYSAGSVFKLFVAVCALENGLNPEYECKGEIRIRNTEYACQNKKRHGV
ncbi:MAG: hypothetical protein K6C14_06875 [Eubacterium sp.]|nr:hypothetical protein [Eubacterium sp.]